MHYLDISWAISQHGTNTHFTVGAAAPCTFPNCSLPRRWHIALAIAILSAALHLSIARQGQRVAVPGGHGHHGALLRQLALAAAVTTEGPAVTSVVQPAATGWTICIGISVGDFGQTAG